ncbi:MAG: argininosuccinate synthase [Verrucomicrobiota bacterium]|jgi:argininosuccinate synthase|nr:argininosuccinate synthase [Verrucomicrobiota bacterium]
MALTLSDLKGKTVGACVSGGLDSRTIAKVMVEAGVKVVAFSADLAQPDEKDINDIKKRMAPCGVDTVIVDLKEPMAEACFQVIEAQAMYDGGYWNSTGIARAVTVRGLVAEMKKRKCTVLVHGATGRGNDQMRFERYTNVLAPAMRVYAPWRDAALLAKFPGRTQMVEFLARYGIQAFVGAKKKYSTDGNLAGLSHEAEDLESMETSMLIVEPTMGVWPQQAPDKIERFTVRFNRGRAVQLNGKDVSPLEAMRLANKLAGRNGIGMKHALENRIIGTKSRGVYEAPGMELLGASLRYIYQATLDRRAGLLFGQLSRLVADQIYDGRYFDPATQAARAAIATFARQASGTVEAGLYKGNIFFNALTGCKASLYNEADSSMEASDGLNPVSSQGFAEIQSVEAQTLARAGQISDK